MDFRMPSTKSLFLYCTNSKRDADLESKRSRYCMCLRVCLWNIEISRVNIRRDEIIEMNRSSERK